MKCYSSALRKTKFKLVEWDYNITRLPWATWSDFSVDLALSSRGLGTSQGPFPPEWFCVLTRLPFRLQCGNIHMNTLLGPIWWQDIRYTSAFLPFIFYHGNSLNTWARREEHLLLHLAAAPDMPALWLLQLNWVVTQLQRILSAHHFCSLPSYLWLFWMKTLPTLLTPWVGSNYWLAAIPEAAHKANTILRETHKSPSFHLGLQTPCFLPPVSK